MIDVVNTPEGSTPVRVIRTTPRERWEGHYERGRKYPLYSVVENNGSIFISVTGKMKEEPYVVYDDETGMFCANDGWIIKEMSADSRLTAIGNKGVAGLAEVTASVDGVGTDVSVSYDGPIGAKRLHFSFFGLQGPKGDRGVSILNVVQTRTSEEDGGTNEVTVTLDNGATSKFNFKNGRAGITEVEASVDPLPGIPGVVTYLDDGVLSIAFSGLKGAQGTPGVNNTYMEIVESLPASASAATLDKIFLIYDEDSGEYKRYYTEFDGSAYGFVQIGTTALDLTDYKRKDSEVWLTQSEFDAILIKDATKTYNIYEEIEESEI